MGLKATALLLFCIVHCGCLSHEISVKFLSDISEQFSAKTIIFWREDKLKCFEDHRQLIKYLTSIMGFYTTCYSTKDLILSPIGFFRALLIHSSNDSSNQEQDINFLASYGGILRYIWIFVLHDENNAIKSVIGVPFNAEFYIFLPEKRGLLSHGEIITTATYKILEAYGTWQHGPNLTAPVGFWGATRGVVFTNATLFERRSNAQGSPMKQIPFVRDQEGGIATKIPEFVPSVWKDITNRINITPILVDKDDQININVINPSPYPMILPVIFRITMKLFHKDRDADLSYSHYFKPFSLLTWITTLVMLIVLGLGLWIAAYRFEKYSIGSLMSHVMDGFYVLFQQDSQNLPVNPPASTAIISLTRLILSVVMYCTYTGVFVAFITFAITKPLFSTFEDIYQDGRYNITSPLLKGYAYIKGQSPNTILNKLFIAQTSPPTEQPNNFHEGIRKICYSNQKLLLGISSDLIDDYMIQYPDCRLSNHPVLLVTLKTTWGFKSGSHYAEVLRISLVRLLESGSVGEIMWKKTVLKKNKDEEHFKPISWLQTLPLLVNLSIGMLTALAAFVIEAVYYLETSTKLTALNLSAEEC